MPAASYPQVGLGKILGRNAGANVFSFSLPH